MYNISGETDHFNIDKILPYTFKRRAFLNLVVSVDIRRHLPGLRHLASKLYPGVDERLLVYKIDYMNHPPLLGVTSLHALMDMPSPGKIVSHILTGEIKHILDLSPDGKQLKWEPAEDEARLSRFIMAANEDYRLGEYVCSTSWGGFDEQEFDVPRLSASRTDLHCRETGQDVKRKRVETCYDEVDEVILRIQQECASRDLKVPWGIIWDFLDSLDETNDKAWPFEDKWECL